MAHNELILSAVVVASGVVCSSLGYVAVAARRERARRSRIDAFVRRLLVPAENRDVRAELQRKKVNKRLKSLEESKRHSKSRIGAVSSLIQQAGLDISVTRFWTICIAMGLAGALFTTLRHMQPWMGPLTGLCLSLVLPRMVLKSMAARRAKEFTKYFVGAIDTVSRGLKSGLPLPECFRIIAKTIPDPCGKIFRQIIDETNVGLSIVVAMQRAYQRMPTQEFMFFCTVVSVQDQTGGNLADILASISTVLRDRSAMREKIKALSGEARASSVIVGILPFAVGGALYVVNYEYISLLWTTRVGEFFLAGAICMMVSGVAIMNKMGKLEV